MKKAVNTHMPAERHWHRNTHMRCNASWVILLDDSLSGSVCLHMLQRLGHNSLLRPWLSILGVCLYVCSCVWSCQGEDCAIVKTFRSCNKQTVIQELIFLDGCSVEGTRIENAMINSVISSHRKWTKCNGHYWCIDWNWFNHLDLLFSLLNPLFLLLEPLPSSLLFSVP